MNALTVALLVMDVLLLWALVTSPRGWWVVKLAAMVLVIALNVVAVYDNRTAHGWPTSEVAPRESLFVGCSVVEPTAIYLWLVPLHHSRVPGAYQPSALEPRAYREPYSPQLHKLCLSTSKTAQQDAAEGMGAQIGMQRFGPGLGKFHAYHLPTPVLPRKGKS